MLASADRVPLPSSSSNSHSSKGIASPHSLLSLSLHTLARVSISAGKAANSAGAANKNKATTVAGVINGKPVLVKVSGLRGQGLCYYMLLVANVLLGGVFANSLTPVC